MNAKDKLIKKLLRSAKKHKVLTYPVLALVAIISFFGNLFNWHNGAGKRVVAIIMVMVMFVSQSYFLTSSATSLVDTEEEALIQKELQETSVEPEDDTEAEKEEAPEQEEKDTADTEASQQKNDEDNGQTADTESEEETVEGNIGTPAVEGEDVTTEVADVTDADVDAYEDEGEMNTKLYNEKKAIKYIFNFSTKTPNTTNKYSATNLMTSDNTGTSIEVDKDASVVDISTEIAKLSKYVEDRRSKEPEYYIDTTSWYLKPDLTQSAGDLKNVPINEFGCAIVYCKRELAQYKVTINHSKVNGYDASFFSTNAEYTDGNNPNSESYMVNVENNSSTKTATFTLSGIRRVGYSLERVEVDSGDDVRYDSNSATITLRGDSPNKNVTLVWRPDEYYLDYYDKDGEKIDIDWPVQFDDTTDRFWVGESEKIGSDIGYVFSGKWKVGSSASETSVDAGSSVSVRSGSNANPYYTGKGNHISLYPEFQYAGIWLNNTDAETFTDNQMSYKSDASSKTFIASYKDSAAGTGKFSFSVEEQGGRNDLSDYGLEFVSLPAANGFCFKPKTDSPIKAGQAVVKVKVTDITDGNVKDEDRQSVVFNVQLNISKCKLSASAGNLTTWKTYDGNANALFATDGSINLPTSVGEVLVNCNLSGAAYNSPNVREADKIIFSSYSLVYTDEGNHNDPSENYELITVDDNKHCYIPGEIKPITVNVKPEVILPESSTAYNINYIRTGEEDPSYKFIYTGTYPGEIPTSWLSDITYTTTRTDKKVEGTYKIDTIDIKTDASVIESGNYKPSCDINDINDASFKVKQEAAEGNYAITGTKKTEDNEWYYGPSISIKAIENTVYDTVYISTNGKDGTYSELGSVTEEYSNDDNVWIYLYSTRTGAVTSRIQLGLKYDATAPGYKGYSFTTKQGEDGDVLDFSTENFKGYDGLYFPGIGGVMDFGTYTKSTIYLNIKFEDKMSGLKTLHYGLFGAEPNKITDFVKIDDTTGYATIEVLADVVPRIGTIKCYAEDNAGNISMPTICLSPTGDNDNYEWCVEQVAPSIDYFAVKYRVGDENDNHYEMVYSGREWYNHCRAELKVSDATAGLREINWYINEELVNTEKYSTKATTSDTLIQAIDPKQYPSEDASYSVYAEILDNAGNVTTTDSIQFKIDDIPPTLNVTYDANVYTKETVIPFKVKDEGGSGLNYVRVQDSDGNTIDCKLEKPNEDGWYESSFDATIKGEYTITAVDHAGNVESWTKDIQMISNEVPACPTITINPAEPDGKNGWYKTLPSVTIQNVKETEDKTPVVTKYQMWLDGENPLNETTVSGDSATKDIPGEGLYHIKAWSTSASGVSCADSGEDETQVQVDTMAPDIDFTISKGNGASILINFTVKDAGSGVNKDTIKVLHGSQELVAELTESDDVYTGSFEVKSTGNYSIVASDNAGNEAEAAAFTPMSMKVKAVTNISASSATLGANVYKGTFDIANVSIAYRKLSDEEFTEAQSMCVKDEKGNEAVSVVLSNLTESTDYVFKVTAVSDAPSDSDAGEVLEYEGYFKTLSSSNSGISVKGTARYATSQEGEITVGVFEGNVCVMATEVNAGDEFTFNNVPDGNYSIVATDGVYSKTMRLLIQDGVVVYPTKYIDLILSGKNTAVVITSSDTPNVTADNMDSIFEDDPINFTNEDVELIEAGGTVEFKLYASLMTVSGVSADEISAMYAVTDNNKIVGAYLDLSLYKIVTDVDGEVDRKRVTELARGANVSVTIPLGELAGKSGLEVVRIHDTGDRYVGTSLQDMDNNPNTYTITTSQFSTYAVLYDPDKKEEPKTEQVTEQTTEAIKDGTSDPASNGNINSGNTSADVDPDSDDTKTDKNESGKNSSGVKNSSVGSLRSSGTAKTGDTAPVTVLGFVMFMSMAGFIILKRKNQR